ncbi:MAG: RDD family protein [Thermoanaerobaculia bacterium]
MSSAPLSDDFDIRKLGFFCPYCGVKNNAGQTQCFVCGKKLPSDFDTTPSPISRKTTISGATYKASPNVATAARLGDRFIAVVLDMVFLAAILLFVGAVLWSEHERFPLTNMGMIAVGSAIAFVIAFLYYFLLEGAFGATLGKAIIGVRVATMSGRRGGFRASAIRNAIRVVEGLPLYIPGFFVALFSKARRRIGDIAAQTVVLEHDLPVAARAALVLGWLAGIAAAIWGTYLIWPEWFRLIRR